MTARRSGRRTAASVGRKRTVARQVGRRQSGKTDALSAAERLRLIRLVTCGGIFVLLVRKGSMIWLTGSQKLVDVRQKDGTTVKKLKIWLTDFGFLPGQSSKAKSESGQHDPDGAAPVPSPPEVMNGDREPLPE